MASGRAFLVTGTDTGIGKTTVTCCMAAALAKRGLRVGVAKPFETGCERDVAGSLVPADAMRLRYFAGCTEPLDVVCPYRCAEPLAPSVALQRARRTADLIALRSAVEGIVARHDVTFVEGAGGLLVPVAGKTTFADLGRDWDLSVLIVVGNRLGALNHAQLTVRAAEASGLRVAGYVVNALSAASDVAAETNVATLTDLLGPPLGVVPWLGPVECSDSDRRRLAEAAEQAIDLAALAR